MSVNIEHSITKWYIFIFNCVTFNTLHIFKWGAMLTMPPTGLNKKVMRGK